MRTQDHSINNKSTQPAAIKNSEQKSGEVDDFQFEDNRLETNIQRKLIRMVDRSPRTELAAQFQKVTKQNAAPQLQLSSRNASFIIQRTPEGALQPRIPVDPEIMRLREELLSMVRQAYSIATAPYSKIPTDYSRKHLMNAINRLLSQTNAFGTKEEFIRVWNQELTRGHVLFLPKNVIGLKRGDRDNPSSNEETGVLSDPLIAGGKLSIENENVTEPPTKRRTLAEPGPEQPSFIMDPRLWAAIENWFFTPMSNKSMTPDKKLGRLQIQGNLLVSDLSEDFWVALKLFFVHTAGFDPIEKQGRDINSKGEGTYYRSSKNSVKDLVKKHFLESILKSHPGMTTHRKTVRAHNEPLRALLDRTGTLSSNIKGMNRFQLSGADNMTFGMYKSAQGSHTGSLGFPSNSIKSMRMLERLGKGKTKPSYESAGGEFKTLIGRINPALLKPNYTGNYHDFLLQNRAHVVQEVAQWISQQPALCRAGIRPIQSAEHPSIIIYHPDYVDGSNEKEWRELMMNTFNRVAASLGYATQINRRGSFGFLYPTISSVGGPVRIWPGLIPASIFKSIMKQTIVGVFNQKNPSFAASLAVDPSDLATGVAVKEDNPLLHQEALRTAIGYTFGVFKQTKNRPQNTDVYKWVLFRLNKNLLKAQFLLDVIGQLKTQKEIETHYLKSTLVIENLMEYSYMLQALILEGNEASHDPYPEHIKEALIPKEKDGKPSSKDIETFYLDSGMQAIVSANLLAKEFQNATNKKQGARQVLDLNSYFEYASVHKGNLQLEPFDTSLPGRPDIISADLNPVLTAPDSKKIDPARALEHYSDRKGRGKTIPIIDITNSTLSKAAKLNLGRDYDNFIVLESLTKHHQLGADKFTMGRLNVIGSPEFLTMARKIIGPIADNAYDPLWMQYRLSMDQEFYGKEEQSSKKKDFPISQFGFQSPFFFQLTHEDMRKNEDLGSIIGISNETIHFFKRMERGVFDHQFRGNSCGFLTLDTTREELQRSLMHTIRQRTHPEIQQILDLIGDEVANSIINEQRLQLSDQHLSQIWAANQEYNSAEENRVNEIKSGRDFLAENYLPELANVEMNIDDVLWHLNNWTPVSETDNLLKEIFILTLMDAKNSYQVAVRNLNRIYTSRELAIDYLQNNLLGQQQLGHNTARAWAIANNIELHVWTEGEIALQEISPQDVIRGGRVVHMLHTSNQTHFQELIPDD